MDLEGLRLSPVSTAKRPPISQKIALTNFRQSWLILVPVVLLVVVVLDLHLRGSVAAATSPTAASSSSWVLDSGASFHVTFDQLKLASSKPILDGDSIQTADGTLCHITHEGSHCNSHFIVPKISLYLSCLWIFSP
jgi:hypothetical protein